MNEADAAPELSRALQWVNCGPQTLAAQQGRIVALVFWQAGSVLSHATVTDLQYLQRRHAESLTVIGIHAPKFEAERSQRLVLKTINRLELQFPVAIDNDFVAWQHYDIKAWPTVVLLDSRGQRAGQFVGDMQRDALDKAIAELIEQAGIRGLVYESRGACTRPETPLALAFPSGIAVASNHLYVADTGHHRILECSLDGRVLRQFGSGNAGLIDGDSGECCFQRPRGLFLSRDTLYVADTGNHALRAVRLLDGGVTTLAGNGRAGLLDGIAAGPAGSMTLNSPWSLVGSSDRLYIAMAGAQQIWEFNQSNRSLRVLSGTGRLGLVDGGPKDACFGQPAGIALVEQTLYICDSAASAIRSLHLPSGQVYTMMGQGLYEFGEVDGGRTHGRLQYPCAVAADPRSPSLWIADTYNNSIRTLRTSGGDLQHYPLGYRLHEPAALAAAGNVLWIANTNAHEVLRCELGSDAVKRLPIGE